MNTYCWPKQNQRLNATSCLCVQKGATTRSCRNAPMHGIAPARRARPWIHYGPSEQSRWAPQLGQRSWHACMSIIICPHMGHSFFLPAAIHHTPGSAPYYSCRQARCLRQRLPCLCAHMRQSCRMRGSPVKCGQPVQAPTEPHGPGLNAYRSLTSRFRGPSGCMGQDGVQGRQGSRPPMPLPLSLRSRRLFVSPSSPSAWSPYPSSACAGPFPALVSFRRLS